MSPTLRFRRTRETIFISARHGDVDGGFMTPTSPAPPLQSYGRWRFHIPDEDIMAAAAILPIVLLCCSNVFMTFAWARNGSP